MIYGNIEEKELQEEHLNKENNEEWGKKSRNEGITRNDIDWNIGGKGIQEKSWKNVERNNLLENDINKCIQIKKYTNREMKK